MHIVLCKWIFLEKSHYLVMKQSGIPSGGKDQVTSVNVGASTAGVSQNNLYAMRGAQTQTLNPRNPLSLEGELGFQTLSTKSPKSFALDCPILASSSNEQKSKLLVSPLTTPLIVPFPYLHPYTMLYNLPLRSLDSSPYSPPFGTLLSHVEATEEGARPPLRHGKMEHDHVKLIAYSQCSCSRNGTRNGQRYWQCGLGKLLQMSTVHGCGSPLLTFFGKQEPDQCVPLECPSQTYKQVSTLFVLHGGRRGLEFFDLTDCPSTCPAHCSI